MTSGGARAPRTLALAAVAALLPGCGDATRASPPAGKDGAPPRVDVASLPADGLVRAVLQHCHAGLEGMDRVVALVTLPDGAQLQAFAQLPGHLRVQRPGGEVQLLAGGRALSLRGSTATELEDGEAARLRALATLLDVAALGPLHRAEACERVGPRTFRLRTNDGASWQLVLRDGSLLVESMRGPAGEVEVLEHLRTTSTWIVQRARIDPLGVCALRFLRHDFDWDDAMFAAPAKGGDAHGSAAVVRQGGERRPATPRLEREPAARWVVLDDPGDWDRRSALVQQRCSALRAQGQELAGFPGLVHEDGRDLLVIPFASRDARAFTAPAGWQVRDLPARSVLLVFPPAGDVAQRIRAGTDLLQQALAAQSLTAAGPILAQPYFHLDEGPPPAAKVAAPVVRMTVPVR